MQIHNRRDRIQFFGTLALELVVQIAVHVPNLLARIAGHAGLRLR
jgi:hypothetical protein